MSAVGTKTRWNQRLEQYVQNVFQEVMIKLNVLLTNKIKQFLKIKIDFHTKIYQ